MSVVSVNLINFHVIKCKQHKYAELEFRGVIQKTTTPFENKEIIQVNERYAWPVTDPVERGELLTVRFYKRSRWTGSARPVGAYRLGLHLLVKNGHVRITDTLIDDRNKPVPVLVEMDCFYHIAKTGAEERERNICQLSLGADEVVTKSETGRKRSTISRVKNLFRLGNRRPKDFRGDEEPLLPQPGPSSAPDSPDSRTTASSDDSKDLHSVELANKKKMRRLSLGADEVVTKSETGRKRSTISRVKNLIYLSKRRPGDSSGEEEPLLPQPGPSTAPDFHDTHTTASSDESKDLHFVELAKKKKMRRLSLGADEVVTKSETGRKRSTISRVKNLIYLSKRRPGYSSGEEEPLLPQPGPSTAPDFHDTHTTVSSDESKDLHFVEFANKKKMRRLSLGADEVVTKSETGRKRSTISRVKNLIYLSKRRPGYSSGEEEPLLPQPGPSTAPDFHDTHTTVSSDESKDLHFVEFANKKKMQRLSLGADEVITKSETGRKRSTISRVKNLIYLSKRRPGDSSGEEEPLLPQPGPSTAPDFHDTHTTVSSDESKDLHFVEFANKKKMRRGRLSRGAGKINHNTFKNLIRLSKRRPGEEGDEELLLSQPGPSSAPE